MLVCDWMLEAPLPQKDVIRCGRGRGFDAPGLQMRVRHRGSGDDGVHGLRGLSPHRHLCGCLCP
jgi:hypothetical protein